MNDDVTPKDMAQSVNFIKNKKIANFSLIRLENNSLYGTPDLLVYNDNGHFFTIELKVTKSNKSSFHHQIAFHVRHPTTHLSWSRPLVQVPETFPGSSLGA